MFRPNVPCTIIAPGPTDQYGKASDGSSTSALCGIVNLTTLSARTSIRTDASATRGSAREQEAMVEILLPITAKVGFDYIIVVNGKRFRVVKIDPQFNVVGQLDHYQVNCDDWS